MVLPLLNTAVLHTRHRNESPMKISYQNGNIGIRTEREETGLHPVLTGLWDWFCAGY